MKKTEKLMEQLKSNVNVIILMAFCATIVLLSACKNNNQPNVSNIKIEIESRRLDKDFAQLDTNNLPKSLNVLYSKYPDFLNFYLDTLMGFGIHGDFTDSNSKIQLNLKPFIEHKDIRGLFDTVQKDFPKVDAINDQLKIGFQYLKYYFPNFQVPKIIYFISGLNQWSVITVDTSIVGIGLDMYLGEHYPFYESVEIPEYAIKKCKPDYIPTNVFQAIYRVQHPFVIEGRTLLDMMIQRGKEQYFLSKILPNTSEEIRLGYSKSQLDWCKTSESQVYNFFVKDNLLYETNWQKIIRYVNDGPNATGMPTESPGNIGSWVGLQIVNAYMELYPKTTMQQLFEMNDAQRLLQLAKYKPH